MRIKGMVRRLAVSVAAIVAMTGGVVAVTSAPAAAAACYGAGCTGQNPEGRCNGDAKTVGAMDVNREGIIELRWSPSCVANWGRFTPYSRTEAGYAAAGIAFYARVTVWNAGAPSQGTAYHGLNLGESTYSHMTDGRPRACTGVEIFHIYNAGNPSGAPGDMQSQGWFWGPCY